MQVLMLKQIRIFARVDTNALRNNFYIFHDKGLLYVQTGKKVHDSLTFELDFNVELLGVVPKSIN